MIFYACHRAFRVAQKFGALVDQAPVGAEITSIVAETPNAVELISFALFFPLTKLPAVELLLKLNKANVAGAAPILESAAPMLILNSASDDGAIRDSATEAIEEFRGIGSVDTFNLLLATTGSEAVPDKYAWVLACLAAATRLAPLHACAIVRPTFTVRCHRAERLLRMCASVGAASRLARPSPR